MAKKRRIRTPANQERAMWAKSAVDHFSSLVHANPEPLETKITDLVADLMHLSYQEGIDWGDVTRRADDHFRAEVSSEEDPHEWIP